MGVWNALKKNAGNLLQNKRSSEWEHLLRQCPIWQKNGIPPKMAHYRLMIFRRDGKPVWWLCSQCGHEWQASPNNRKKGVGCPCCSGRVPKIGVNDLATLYPELLEEWDCSQNKDLDPGQLLPGSGKKAWWKCSQCGYEWQTGIASRTKGHGCPKCSKRKKNNPS